MNGNSDKEMFEFQNSTIRIFKKAVRDIEDRFKPSKNLTKNTESVLLNLETYEIMYDTLYKVREVSSKIMRSVELDTIEGEMKVLNDTFWN